MTFFVLSVFPAPDSPLKINEPKSAKRGEGGARNQNALVFPFLAHVHPSTFRNGENMGRILVPSFRTILVYDGIRIERQTLVWIYCDKEQARVGLSKRC